MKTKPVKDYNRCRIQISYTYSTLYVHICECARVCVRACVFSCVSMCDLAKFALLCFCAFVCVNMHACVFVSFFVHKCVAAYEL